MIISKCIHGLQACLFKYIPVSAFRIYDGEDAAKWEVGGCALNSHGNYIVDHGKSWKINGIVFFNFRRNPVKGLHCAFNFSCRRKPSWMGRC